MINIYELKLLSGAAHANFVSPQHFEHYGFVSKNWCKTADVVKQLIISSVILPRKPLPSCIVEYPSGHTYPTDIITHDIAEYKHLLCDNSEKLDNLKQKF